MSQNVTFTPLQEKQWRVWKQGKNRGWSDSDIAKKVNRNRKTIDRLKRKAKLNGAYQEWIDEHLDWSHQEFRELHLVIKATNPIVAYNQIGRFIERTLVSKNDMVISGGVAPIIVKMWMPEVDEPATDDSNTV